MSSRRNFIKQSLAGSAAIGFSQAVPDFLLGAARMAAENAGEKILVVVQLTGGNDGLNTVVPYGNDEYYKNRFTLAVGKQNVLKINRDIGFHPALTGFDNLLQDGRLSVIQGVGYPNPNRSHFESMDLWHTAHQVDENHRLGWLGRSVENSMSDRDLPAVHFGNGLQPLALRTEHKPIPSIRSLEDFQLRIAQNDQAKAFLQRLAQFNPETENPLLNYIRETSSVALKTSQRLAGVDASSQQRFGYPGTNLSRNLGAIARLIGSGLSTQIYYTTLDGFDTHSNQAGAHQGLLNDLGSSVEAFMNEIKDQGNQERVVLLSFSEFGRRVRENASGGTDHGTAAPVFLLGSALKQSVVGPNPDLSDLEQGDLKFSIDYRRIYAELLDRWLGVEPVTILGHDYKSLGLLG